MRFLPTEVDGVMQIQIEPVDDERGFFGRTFCKSEFARAGIDFVPTQASLSHNLRALTLRGMHYQETPHSEAKIIHCVRGRVFDVAIDLRSHSPTFRRWVGIELSPEARRLLFIPHGCAHGFLTLDDNSDVAYSMDTPFIPEAARGVRWNDPAFAIEWPKTPAVISSRDANYPDFVS